MKKHFVIVAAITLVLAVLLAACSSSKRDVGQKAVGDAAEAKAVAERNPIEQLITANEKFAVCRVHKIPVRHSVDYSAPDVGLRASGEDDYFSPPSRGLQLLVNLGYVRLEQGWGNGKADGEVFWRPTSKLQSAIGTTIRQTRTEAADLDVGQENMTSIRVPVKSGACSLEEAERSGGRFETTCSEAFSWDAILGCREFVQIDATTPLADGMKVDFSWQWHTTELGTADGLVNSRQRAEAYLRKSSSGMVIDQMYFKP